MAYGLTMPRSASGGKKSTARRIIYKSFEIIEDKSSKNPLEVFEQAVQNVTPRLEVKPRRVGGATYQVPMEVPIHRRTSLAIRWLLSNKPLSDDDRARVLKAENTIDDIARECRK